MRPFPETVNDNRLILTVQDEVTKFLQTYALTEHNATAVATKFLESCTQFGFPYFIPTEFTSCTLKELDKLLTMKLCSPYRPESNKALGRSYLTIKNYLKCCVNKDGNDWDNFFNFAIYSYNTNIHKATIKTNLIRPIKRTNNSQ